MFLFKDPLDTGIAITNRRSVFVWAPNDLYTWPRNHGDRWNVPQGSGWSSYKWPLGGNPPTTNHVFSRVGLYKVPHGQFVHGDHRPPKVG